jgi:hypothetical protein
VTPNRIWLEQCAAAQGIEADFGTDKALAYLVGEKFLNFLEAADSDEAFRVEIPAFVAAIRGIFGPGELADYLEIARRTERFDPAIYDDPDEAELERRLELRRSANDLLLVERARDWLLSE